MKASKYLCAVIGESQESINKQSRSSRVRAVAFGFAIHIPVILWSVTGYIIARNIFKLDLEPSLLVAGFCSLMIYLVERLVIAMPKSWFINLGRLAIGLIIAILGASTVDLVIFDREVTQQLVRNGERRIQGQFNDEVKRQKIEVAERREDWAKAKAAANCEANGSCGSGTKNLGPVARELLRQATVMGEEYKAASLVLEKIRGVRDEAVASYRLNPTGVEDAGLLERIRALHQYTKRHKAAFAFWVLFFLLVLSFELMVIAVKFAFGETVDDKTTKLKEMLDQKKAENYFETITSPMFKANQVLSETYN